LAAGVSDGTNAEIAVHKKGGLPFVYPRRSTGKKQGWAERAYIKPYQVKASRVLIR